MISKVVLTDAFESGSPSTSVVPTVRSGISDDWQRKHASVTKLFADKLSGLKIPKNHTVVHILALGDEERYGCNRNCDAFSRDDNIKKHHTFVDLGHLFRNHQNDDPEKAIGSVLASAHNDLMDRVELLVAHCNDRSRQEIQALERGEDLAYSMGAAVKFDRCSYCGHEAPTAKNHCVHVKKHLGEVLEDGTRIYMQNPDPNFFDISSVFKPADRIAYMIRKVAGSPLAGYKLAEAYDFEKLAAKNVLATIIKKIPLHARGIVQPSELKPQTKQQLKRACDCHGVQQVLRLLSDRKALLSPEDFGDIVVGGKGCECAQAQQSGRASLDSILDDHTTVDAFDPPGKGDYVALDDHALADLHESASLELGPAQRRAMKIIIIQQPKLAATVSPIELDALGKLYACYKIALAKDHIGDRPFLNTLAATF